MTLPKLETPMHSCVLPIAETKVEYRPFLVGEQKVLLMAQESEDQNTQIKEMMRLIDVCCDDVDVKQLATTDLEYLFLQIRVKSVGETAKVNMICQECETENELDVDLENVKVVGGEEKANNTIDLTDTISLDLQYPSYDMMKHLDVSAEEQSTEDMFILMAACITSIKDGDEIHTKDDFNKKELMSFLDSMSLSMFEEVQTYFATAPTIELPIKYKCTNCESEQRENVVGIANFFN
jgi:hypothetical protein